MKTSFDVLGKPVISLDDGLQLRGVEDLLFSEDQNHMLGFMLKAGWVAEPIFVAFGDVDAFGPDALFSVAL